MVMAAADKKKTTPQSFSQYMPCTVRQIAGHTQIAKVMQESAAL
jgi:hypothetical protein